MYLNGEPRMSDKLFIDLWGATISAGHLCHHRRGRHRLDFRTREAPRVMIFRP
jgi:hypothetical protein